MDLLILGAAYVILPIIIIHLCVRFKFLNRIGAVLIAYIIGLVIGNLNILPEGSQKIQDAFTTVTIPLGIPLLLFSTNIRRWSRLAGKTLISMLISLIGLSLMVIIGKMIFDNGDDKMWKVSGMLIGVYSGGTPNLAALKMMLDVDPNIFLITHTYDMTVSAVYLLFLMTIGQKVFLLILKPFQSIETMKDQLNIGGAEHFEGLLRKENIKPLLKSFLFAIIIFTVGGSLSLLVSENSQMVVAILSITTLGIVFSFIPAVNKTPKSFELGMYLIIVFCLVVASMADIKQFATFNADIFFYIVMVIFGSLIFHVLISRLFNVDADTMMITSTALICSPPFVPAIAGAIKNREVIVSGLTVGIIGYAIGNYLGYFIAYLVKGL
ncbi:MAG: DUF819 family protein [Bacteroidales bacterium]|nr:DUF819 family protein [Bacteroidales bacterium]